MKPNPSIIAAREHKEHKSAKGSLRSLRSFAAIVVSFLFAGTAAHTQVNSGGDAILTVRFAKRGRRVRTIGAGYWRKGKRLYETQNQLH